MLIYLSQKILFYQVFIFFPLLLIAVRETTNRLVSFFVIMGVPKPAKLLYKK